MTASSSTSASPSTSAENNSNNNFSILKESQHHRAERRQEFTHDDDPTSSLRTTKTFAAEFGIVSCICSWASHRGHNGVSSSARVGDTTTVNLCPHIVPPPNGACHGGGAVVQGLRSAARRSTACLHCAAPCRELDWALPPHSRCNFFSVFPRVSRLIILRAGGGVRL